MKMEMKQEGRDDLKQGWIGGFPLSAYSNRSTLLRAYVYASIHQST